MAVAPLMLMSQRVDADKMARASETHIHIGQNNGHVADITRALR